MSESVRTVTPELPKAIPTHLIGDHLSSGASVQSLTLCHDGMVPNLARGMAITLEKSLELLFPTLRCRCVGYVRQTTLPITVAYEHEGELTVFPVAATIDEVRRMSMLELHDHLLQQASNEIVTRIGKYPEV